jgi:superkiller protein 3
MELMKRLATVFALAMASQSGLAEAQTLENLLQQGNRAWTERRYVEAEAAYRQAIVLDPKNSRAYTNLGDVLDDQKKYVEAEAALRQATALDPKNSRAYIILGVVLMNQKKYVEAEAALRQAIALDPKDVDAYIILGVVLRNQKKYVEAEAAYRQAIVLDPKNAFAYNNLGYLFQLLERLTEARDLYLKVLALDPANKTARSNFEEVERLIGIADGKLQQLAPEDIRYLTQDPNTPVRRSVVRILPNFPGKSSGAGAHGTGFVVRRQGDKAWILTARHVIRDPDEGREATEIQIELYGGNLPAGIVPSRLLARQVKMGEGDLDLALLVVVGLPEDIQTLRFALRPVEAGIPLTMVGHPGKARWSVERGKLSVVSQQGLLISCPGMAPGGSGSPVLSDMKEVIGMAYEINEGAGIKQVVGYSRTKLQETLSHWGQ